MRKLLKLTIISLTIFAATIVSAQQEKAVELPENVRSIKVDSASMDKQVDTLVVLPESYDKNSDKRYSVIYLLHGFGGNHTTWATRTKPDLHKIASALDVIFVCPDGDKSWYWDAPKNPKVKYETFVSKELVNYIDANYRTIKSNKARAITGFSMGGHGGLWLGIRHPEVFGACGSMSGGVDIRPFPANWAMKESLGDYNSNEKNWDTHTVINQLYKLSPDNTPAIIIDCGIGDFFYQVNEELHKKMLYMRIPHEYITRPGAHTHAYWNNAVDFQIMFFKKRFPQN